MTLVERIESGETTAEDAKVVAAVLDALDKVAHKYMINWVDVRDVQLIAKEAIWRVELSDR